MLLYHYAKAKYPELRTLRKQHTLSEDELAKSLAKQQARFAIGLYVDHLSFFMEPAPLDVIGELYAGRNHKVWIPGATLYEHIVESKTLGDFKYDITETPGDIAEMNADWPEDVDLTEAQMLAYFKKKAARKQRAGETGVGNTAFERAAKPYLQGIGLAYINASKTYDDYNWQQYAPSVPHVMIYPPSGVAHLIQKPRKVMVGLGKKANASSRW